MTVEIKLCIFVWIIATNMFMHMQCKILMQENNDWKNQFYDILIFMYCLNENWK